MAPAWVFAGLRPVWLLAFALGTVAVAMCVPFIGVGAVAGGVQIPWWTLLIAFIAAEIMVVHLTFGSHSVSFSLSEIPITLSFGAISPIGAVGLRVVGSLVGLIVQRVRGTKLAFNIASAALETATATIVYRTLLGDAHPLEPRGWLAGLAAALAVDVVSGVTITAAMSLVEGRFDAKTVPEIAVSGCVAATTNSCLAVIALIVLAHDPRAGLALGVITGIVLIAYRAWAVQARRFGDLEILYEFTRALDAETDTEGLVRVALGQAKRLTGATHAELIVVDAAELVERWTLSADEPGGVRVQTGLAAASWWTEQQDATFAPSSSKDPQIRARLLEIGRKDALIALLRSPRRSHGAILVADREDDVSTFSAADLKLLETLANHVAVELDNAHLVDRLRVEAADKAHLALHDSLTQLPNRRWFNEQVQAALYAGGPVAVMLMDLDRFKEINDTLGHSAGDRVLTAVADRLSKAVAGRGFVARFGGDEFAFLLHVVGADAACAVAREVLAALHTPVTIDHLAVDLGASIGIALAPLHGDQPDLLVQHADVAMYIAKDRQSGVELYSFERDLNDVRRLNLVTELRRAIADQRLNVHYQIQVDVSTDTITGVEALVRWTSDQYGVIGPDEFIPIAECTGQIGLLTSYVLTTAIRDCAQWRSNGWNGSVSVNISARSLLDHDLPMKVASLLAAASLPAEALTLEITETSIMRDPDRNIELLGRLKDIGVHLSIDDFGTGYSSLSYLKKLPVGEVKIDKSFVASIEWDEGDRAIVKATIRLSHDLGLTIVAEGVETQASFALLQRWGADVAQGYYFGRPVPASDIERRLARPTLTLVKNAS